MISVEKETLTLLYLPLHSHLHSHLHSPNAHRLYCWAHANNDRTHAGPTSLSLYRSYSHSHPLLSTLTKGSQSSARCTQHPSSPHDRRWPAYTHTVYSHTSSPYYRYRRRQ